MFPRNVSYDCRENYWQKIGKKICWIPNKIIGGEKFNRYNYVVLKNFRWESPIDLPVAEVDKLVTFDEINEQKNLAGKLRTIFPTAVLEYVEKISDAL